MGNYEALARRFAEASLRAEVIPRTSRTGSSRTSGTEAADVFQMSVEGRGRSEFFRIWPGAQQNRVEPQGVDRGLRQLVLLVQEPVRTFTQRLHKRSVTLDRTKVKVLGEDELFVWVEQRTEARKRHFLCGRDERQLFICQLPRPVSAVRDAHQALRATVPQGVAGKVLRQGEWFFLEPSRSELAALELALRRFRTVIRTGVPIGRGGHPHVADELVRVPAIAVGDTLVGPTVMVRGRVRHQDHDTVVLRGWTKVVRNAEPVADDGLARMDGVRWID